VGLIYGVRGWIAAGRGKQVVVMIGGGLVSQGVAGKGAGMVWIFLQNSKRRRKKSKKLKK
jgi:hypothetical protein